MGVALENARLFGETKRLLTETEERAAELAIINSVQQGLAAELDMQAMYELVGDKIQRDLRRAGRRHRHLRPRRASSTSRTRSSAACASRTSRSASIGFRGRSSRRGEPLVIDDVPSMELAELRAIRRHPGRAAEVAPCVR